MKNFWVRDMKHIVHPLADHISVQDSPSHHAVLGVSSELAFFYRGKFQVEIIEEFADYSDGADGDTRVYSYVPNELVDEFLATWGV